MSPARQSLAVLHLLWVHERGQFQFALFNTFVMPATLAYLGAMLLGDSPAKLRWWLAGSVTFGLGMGGLAQVGFAILNDRFLGRLDLLRASPVSKSAYYVAQIAVAVLQAVALVVVSLIAFRLLGLARADAASLAVGALVAVCAASAIGGLGAAMAFRARDFDRGNTVVAIAALGLAAASPVFYELSDLPALLRPVAMLSPFTHIAPLLRALFDGDPVPPTALAVTLVLAVVINAASYCLARWQE